MDTKITYTDQFPYIEIVIYNVSYSDLLEKLDFISNHILLTINNDIKFVIHKDLRNLISSAGQKYRIYYSRDKFDRYLSLISLEMLKGIYYEN